MKIFKKIFDDFIDSRDLDIWYDRGYNNGKEREPRFNLFFCARGDNINAYIKDAYNQGYDDGFHGYSYGRRSFYR